MTPTPLPGGLRDAFWETRDVRSVRAGLDGGERRRGDGAFRFTLRNDAAIVGLSVAFRVATAFHAAAPMNAPPVAVGPDGLGRRRFDDTRIAIHSVIVAPVRQHVGPFPVILPSGPSAIDRETTEAAEVDGATTLQKAASVTFPWRASTRSTAIVPAAPGRPESFERVFVMTGGPPCLSSTVVTRCAAIPSVLRGASSHGNTIAVAIVRIGPASVTSIWLRSGRSP